MQADSSADVASAAGPDPPPRPTSTAPLVRALLIVVGTVSLLIGVLGVFLPVLPTTPFLLVTAACYARASDRLYRWLLGQPSLGPIVAEWRRSRSLPPGVKTRALLVVAITFAISIVVVESLVVQLALVLTGAILMTFLFRLPTAQASASSATTNASAPHEDAL